MHHALLCQEEHVRTYTHCKLLSTRNALRNCSRKALLCEMLRRRKKEKQLNGALHSRQSARSCDPALFLAAAAPTLAAWHCLQTAGEVRAPCYLPRRLALCHLRSLFRLPRPAPRAVSGT
eukprot:1933041-Rhodomonas_salina.1